MKSDKNNVSSEQNTTTRNKEDQQTKRRLEFADVPIPDRYRPAYSLIFRSLKHESRDDMEEGTTPKIRKAGRDRLAVLQFLKNNPFVDPSDVVELLEELMVDLDPILVDKLETLSLFYEARTNEINMVDPSEAMTQ